MSYSKRSSKNRRSRQASLGWPTWGIVTLGVGCFLIVVLGAALGFLLLTKRSTEQATTTPSTVLLNPTASNSPNNFAPPSITADGHALQPQQLPPDFRIEQPPPQFKFKDNSALVEKQEPGKKQPQGSIEENGYTLIEKEEIFKPKNECFTILLPAAEKVRTSFKLIDLYGDKIPIESGSSVQGVCTKSVTSFILGLYLLKKSEAEVSDMIVESMYKSKEGKLKGKKMITTDTVDGREFLLEFSESALRLQVYVIGGLLVISAVEDKDLDSVRSVEADKFLDGLKFSDKTKMTYNNIKQSRKK